VSLTVEHEDVGLAGLALADRDELPRLEPPELSDGQLEEIAGTEPVVDPESEQQEVAGPVGQKAFDRPYVFGASDGVGGSLVARSLGRLMVAPWLSNF